MNEILKKIQLIVYDFDGVMTNNMVYVDKDGNEFVQVTRADGLGVSEIKKLSIKQIIISTEKNRVVLSRAKKLDIDCIYGVENKKEILIDYCKKNNFSLNNVAFVGNDINDKFAMESVGFSLCPSDAHKSIKKIASHILDTKGGHGVIREFFEYLNND